MSEVDCEKHNDSEKESAAVQHDYCFSCADDQVATFRTRLQAVEQQLERAKTYKGHEAWPCPLCSYKEGVFQKLCTLHEKIKAVEQERDTARNIASLGIREAKSLTDRIHALEAALRKYEAVIEAARETSESQIACEREAAITTRAHSSAPVVRLVYSYKSLAFALATLTATKETP